MLLSLICHPDSRCEAVSRIAVEVERAKNGVLNLEFVIDGKIEDLALPPASASARTDDLWQHTCFETFLRSIGEEGYREFNFSPSTQWAAYSFDSYRSGMSAAGNAPLVEVRMEAARFILRAVVSADRLSDVRWQLGLSAVIEEKSGRKSYWALAHPSGRPDFHHSDCFALELAEP